MKRYVLLSFIILVLLQLSCHSELPIPEPPNPNIPADSVTEIPADSIAENPADSIPGTPGDSVSVVPADSIPADSIPVISPEPPQSSKIRVIFDTDANNELDDQHALAYLFFNGGTFHVEGVTVNTTWNGGNIDKHYAEALRVIQMCNVEGRVPLLKGANSSFVNIKDKLSSSHFDGHEAVDFIIKKAHEPASEKLIVLAVGKLTNLALALEKDPSIKQKIKIVWLGSNYPQNGEYNMINDVPSMNYVLEQDVPFEMVTVRYNKTSGTDAVRASKDEINAKMPGKGPLVGAVAGRHGGAFTNFGDYSVDLFARISLYGNPPSRALFDMAAVAIVKDPSWAQKKVVPCPTFLEAEKKWVEQPNNVRKITIWENFDKSTIMEDFFGSMNDYELVNE